MKVRYLLVTLLMLALYLWAAARQRDVSALPSDFDLRRLHFPVRIQAEALPTCTVGSPAELRFAVQQYPIGSALQLTGTRGLHAATTVAAASTFYLVIAWLNAFMFWIVSALVFAPRIERVPARDLYWACILYGLAVTIGDVHVPRVGTRLGLALPALRVVAVTLLPVLLLHVSLSFPIRRGLLDRWRLLIPSITALGFILSGWYVWMLQRYFAAPDTAAWHSLGLPRFSVTLFLALVFTVGCAWFWQTSRMAENESQRDQAKWILWGIAFGATPFILLHALPRLWGEPLLPVEVARLFSIVIPAAFTFAVVRYKFLDIDVIIRRSVVYSCLALIMVGIYFVLGVWLGNHVEARFPAASRYIPMVAAIVPVLLFRPTHRFMSRWLDRTFFKIRFDHKRALDEYTERIHTASSQAQLASGLHNLLATNLATSRCGVIVAHGDYVEAAGNIDPDLLRGALDTFRERFATRWGVLSAPNATSLPEIADGNFPTSLVQRGIRIAHPLGDGEKLLGVVLLGEKKSERRYVEDELDFMRGAAQETSSCLEYVDLVQRIQKESLARKQLAEMNRFKSDFFSQVAHDLRSPLTSISWSARNLLDGVIGNLDPAQREYIQGMAASAEQLVRLVNNLLEIARMEQHQTKLDLEALSMRELLDEATRRLDPIASAKDVRFDVEVDVGLDPVAGNRGKMLEIVDNLLDNAVRFSPPGQVVEVTLAREAPGRQCLTIRDHGPGLDEAEAERVFGAYQQGQPSPYSSQQGFGLGLHIVKTYVELMGGSIMARNHRDGGALFTCTLVESVRHGEES